MARRASEVGYCDRCGENVLGRPKTTRHEDEAYYRIGLFGINMPLLYGKGEQSFIRLQQEIIKASEDQTIFAWGYGLHIEVTTPRSVSAWSASLFTQYGSHDVGKRMGYLVDTRTSTPYEITNIGLRITIIRVSYEGSGTGKNFAVLPVTLGGDQRVCLPITWSKYPKGNIEKLPDEAVIERYPHEQPITLCLPESTKLVQKSVILRSIPRTSYDPDHRVQPYRDFGVYLFCDSPPSTSILETWCPNLKVDQHQSEQRMCLMLIGSWSAHRSNPWPIYVRLRYQDSFTSKQYLLVIPLDTQTAKPRVVRVFE
ncbi:hypothetical protein GE09DRAFT_500191 [Coniochaeta sp. 2T2.1]|nr:hypothetical protein GE09DRAFT_500191 [Coniochaeta sp. 2T2.1]